MREGGGGGGSRNGLKIVGGEIKHKKKSPISLAQELRLASLGRNLAS